MTGVKAGARPKGSGKSAMLDRFDRAFAEFIGGLTEFSALAAWTAALLLAASLALAAWFFRYETLAGPEGAYLVRSAKDAEGHATVRALQIPRLSQERPQLIVLGSSITGTALADQTALDKAVDRATGRDWDVSILCTPLQSAFDQLTLLEAALAKPPSHQVLVVIGINPMRNGYSPREIRDRESLGRLGLRSDWADEALLRAGGTPRARSRWYLVENREFVALNGKLALLRLLARRPVSHDPALIAPRRPLPVSERRRDRLMERISAAHAKDTSLSQDLLVTIRQRLEAYPQVRLATIDETVNPAALASLGLTEKDAAIRARFRAWAAASGLPFWELAPEVSPPPAVYFDDLHINSRPVQQAFREALARRVAAFEDGAHGR